MTASFVLLASSYMGKSTAHRSNLVVDPEELGAYRVWREGWADPVRANDLEWRRAAGAAYDALRLECIASDASFVAVHPPHFNPSDPHTDWASWPCGERVLLVLLPSRTAFRRALEQYQLERRAGFAHANARLSTFITDTERALALVTDGAPGLITHSVSCAVHEILQHYYSDVPPSSGVDPFHPHYEALVPLAVALLSLRRAMARDLEAA